jgi:putative membrane protein
MIDPFVLPTVNAILNSVSAFFLILGYGFIRSKKVSKHRICMILAFCCSILFLISYLTYHYIAGSRSFPGTGNARTFYLGVLLTHTILAAIVPPLAMISLYHGLKGRFEKHRKVARWTFPIWLYVSLTGVVVYWMLYRMVW